MGLRVSIYRSNYDSELNVFHGCRNITLTNVEGPFEPTEDSPAGKLVQHAGNWIIRPDDGFTEKLGVEMNGGTYGSTSDSRFREATGIYAAIPIHDRRETWEQYEQLSR